MLVHSLGWCGCAVLQCDHSQNAQHIYNEEYTNMQSVYSFCSGNGRATVVKYRQ
jgi:hypothetical protein